MRGGTEQQTRKMKGALVIQYDVGGVKGLLEVTYHEPQAGYFHMTMCFSLTTFGSMDAGTKKAKNCI